jgi:putative ABC transport system permease protein
MFIFLKILKESFVLSLQQLWANRLRTFLSLLGVTVGIFSIIAILTAVDSMKSDIEDDLTKLGNDLVLVQKWPLYTGGEYPFWKYYQRPTASHRDYEYLKERSQTVGNLMYQLPVPNSVVSNGGRKLRGLEVVAGTHDYNQVINMEIGFGRYFTIQESEAGYNVCIIGAEAAEELFDGALDVVDKEIMVDNIRVRIVGVIEKEGQSILGMNFNNVVLLPFEMVNKNMYIDHDQANPEIFMVPREGITMDAMIAESTGLMRNVRQLRPKQDDNFSLSKFSVVANTFKNMLNILGLAGWIIGGLALLVGGFGIANIMYVSVKERTNIIGIKKALGAQKNYILYEFLFESVLLCLIGGSMGLLIIYSLLGTASEASGFEFILTAKNITIGLGVSALIGVIAGILPALKAANLDPVEAIRAK